jgi:hypothetical protein
MVVARTIERRNQFRQVSIQRVVSLREQLGKAVSDGRQAIFSADVIEGGRLLREHKGSHQREEHLPETRAKPFRNGEIRHDEM